MLEIKIDKSDQLLDVKKSPKELYPIVSRVNELVTRVRDEILNELNEKDLLEAQTLSIKLFKQINN